MRKHNFNAGPSVLPQAVIDASIAALKNFRNTGLSVAEVSHRSVEWEAVMDECRNSWKRLLNIPDHFHILFLSSGASMQFMQVPYNMLNTKAAYLDTGVWASKAIKEAQLFGQIEVVASGKDVNYAKIPHGYNVPADADYLHITTNNTIYGTQIKEDLVVPVPLIADMSSDIMTRPIDFSKYALIYGGAQKNVGTAGVSFVLVNEHFLGKTNRTIPSMMDYRLHIKEESMYNTPPVLPIYLMTETLKHLEALGGIPAIQQLNKAKADLLYSEIDRNSAFKGTANIADRSIMNVCFIMNNGLENQENNFLKLAENRGIVGIKGHRLVGGFRASIYNGLSIESVQVLVDAMRDFEKNA